MEKNDIRLEKIAAQAEDFEVPQSIPIFEIFASLTAIAMSMLLFLVPGFLEADAALYHLMEHIMPQIGWAVALMAVGSISAIGNLVTSSVMRIMGLFGMSGVFAAIGAYYIVEYPNLGSVVMPSLALFCLITVPIVKFTSLGKSKKKRGYEQNDK